MNVSRLNYGKPHRCPSRSGPAWSYGDYSLCGAPGPPFMYERRAWRWRLTRCRDCGVLCLPYASRWLDPAWPGWRLGPGYRRIYGKRH